MSRSLERQLHEAHKDVEQELAWIERCGGTRTGYRANYGGLEGIDPDAIYEADLDKLRQVRSRVADLEFELDRRAKRALAAAKRVSATPLDPGPHVVSYRAECSCGFRGDAFTDITAARRDGQHHDKGSRLVEALQNRDAYPGAR